MSTNSKPGIIFDLDGTLWDSVPSIVPAWNRIFKKTGIDLTLSVDYAYTLMGKTTLEFAEALLPGIPIQQSLEIIRSCCQEEILDLAQKGGVLYPMVAETLRELSKAYTLAIVSNCDPGYVESFIDYYGFQDIIADHECYGGTGLTKGQNIKLVMERSSIGKALYIGDTFSDKQAAGEAGIPFVLAEYGFGSCEAENRISAFSELPKMAKLILS